MAALLWTLPAASQALPTAAGVQVSDSQRLCLVREMYERSASTVAGRSLRAVSRCVGESGGDALSDPAAPTGEELVVRARRLKALQIARLVAQVCDVHAESIPACFVRVSNEGSATR